MDQKALRPNLRSTVFTDDLRAKMQQAQTVIRELSRLDVKVIRTDYSGMRPVIEVDPETARAVTEWPVSMMSTRNDGYRRISRVIYGVEIVWQEAA